MTYVNSSPVVNARQRETDRRRPAYAAFDAAYRAQAINEHARELGKWYVRCCPVGGSWFELTQKEQEKHLGVSCRTIVTLVQQLADAGLIWLIRRGTANRTYITAYQAPPTEVPDLEPDATSEVEALDADMLRHLADEALGTGDTRRAAMYYAQLSQLLAHQSNDGATQPGASFAPMKGEAVFTNKVQAGSPTPVNRSSGSPFGTTAMPVCTSGGGRNMSGLEMCSAEGIDTEEPEIVRRVRALGVGHRATLEACFAAPARAAEVLRACQEQGGGPGLFVHMWHYGIWKRNGKRHPYVPAPRFGPESFSEGEMASLVFGLDRPWPKDVLDAARETDPVSDVPPCGDPIKPDLEVMKYSSTPLPTWLVNDGAT